MPPIRLIALDIDGTLLDSQGQVSAENRAALQAAIDAGVDIVLATGRRYDFARPIFETLPRPLTLILSNGAIVKTPDGETLMRFLLPREIAVDVIARTPEHRRRAAVVFDRPRDGQIVYEQIDWEHPRHRAFLEVNLPFIAERSPLEDAVDEDPIQVMFSGGCGEMRQLFERLRSADSPAADDAGCADDADTQRGNWRAYSVALTEYLHRDFSLVDIVRAGCSKGTTLRRLAESRGLGPEQVMAVGDNLNDLEMLEFAGCPVVMANGLEELKARGWAVTAGHDESGVARAIETFVLGKAS